MPELPEVETIRRDLTPRIVGRTVAEAWVSPDAPRLGQGEPADSFCRRLAGRRVAEPGPRRAGLRRLGTRWLGDEESKVVGKLGPEPLGEALGPQELHRLRAKRSAPVKAVLLDQGAIAGIGNIYADEALFEAGIRPAQAAKRPSRRSGC